MYHRQQSFYAKLDYSLITRLLGGIGVRIGQHAILFLMVIGLTTGCSGITSVGLRPEYPPLEKGSFDIWAKFVEVDSLKPTLRWQRFPRDKDLKADKEGNLDRVEDVSYEVRIWKTVYGDSGHLVYARAGLRSPYHKLDQSLEPSTKYLWTVRARFMLDGRPKVIEWGLAGYLLRGMAVPNTSCFRFSTPAATQDS